MMRVHVTAYGDLRRYLPESQRDMGALLGLPDGATIVQLLDVLRLPYHHTWLIGVNDAIVDLDHALHDGDEIELMLPIGGGYMSTEHIIPLSRSGQTTLDNLALACQGCNNSKYNKTGRVTVETLELNRDTVVNLRRFLYFMGEHPPAEE